MTTIKYNVSAVLLSLVFTTGAYAAGPMGGAGNTHGPMSFSDFDKNGDGMISREEFTATNRNRVQTQTQTETRTETKTQSGAMSAMPGTPPAAAPGVGMGMQQQTQEQTQEQAQVEQQTQQRMRPDNVPTFNSFDLDSDGSVTQKEFYAARNNRIRERVLQGKPMRNMSNAPSFSSIDSNGDNQLSEEEFNAHQDQHMKMWEE